MKKLFALLLCVVLVLGLAACKKDKKEEVTEHTIDVEYYAKIGQIPEHEYHLGSDADEMKQAFIKEDEKNNENSEDGHTHSVYSYMEEEEFDVLSYKSAKYYYRDDKKVAAIVSLDASYDFQIGDLLPQVKSALSKLEAEEKKGDKETIFFLPSPESYTYLEYTFGENRLLFVFQDTALCAVALCDKSI